MIITYAKFVFIIIYLVVVDQVRVKTGTGARPRAGWGLGRRSLARALIAFHLATAHEQRKLAKMKKKNHYINIF